MSANGQRRPDPNDTVVYQSIYALESMAVGAFVVATCGGVVSVAAALGRRKEKIGMEDEVEESDEDEDDDDDEIDAGLAGDDRALALSSLLLPDVFPSVCCCNAKGGGVVVRSMDCRMASNVLLIVFVGGESGGAAAVMLLFDSEQDSYSLLLPVRRLSLL